jgi:hypothetical protein
MTYLTGSVVGVRISERSLVALEALSKVSMTATPSSPIRNPPFAQADSAALVFEIAAQAFGPTCVSVNGGSGDGRAQLAHDRQRITSNLGRLAVSRLSTRLASCLRG